MPIDLTKPMAWTNASHEEQRLLRALQGNILKGHGRSETLNIFFTINEAQKHAMRAALRELANYHATSAYQQLLETQVFQATGKSGEPFVSIFVSAAGYSALDVPDSQIPDDPSFRLGQKAAAPGLNDEPVATWDPTFTSSRIDGMILIASENHTELRRKRDAVVNLLVKAGGTILGEQAGKQLFNAVSEGIEHFGYVDGRSQPLLLVEDIERESQDAGIANWDPSSNLGVALVADPGISDGVSFGSYFIFRKLEQDVRGFKRKEQELADELALTGKSRELAGAYAVGRFEDGTPVTMSSEPRGLTPPNDFNYNADSAGARCPFHAHIRKTNPRGSGGFGVPPQTEFKHLMARRGITYEDVPRVVHPTDIPPAESLADFDANVATLLPTGKVGLLFMAYNHDIGNQFEFTQKAWANNPGFPQVPAGTTPPGLDPVIGQGPASTQHWPKAWDEATQGTCPLSFQGFVKMRGGEYFFAPSLNFLKSL